MVGATTDGSVTPSLPLNRAVPRSSGSRVSKNARRVMGSDKGFNSNLSSGWPSGSGSSGGSVSSSADRPARLRLADHHYHPLPARIIVFFAVESGSEGANGPISFWRNRKNIAAARIRTMKNLMAVASRSRRSRRQALQQPRQIHHGCGRLGLLRPCRSGNSG